MLVAQPTVVSLGQKVAFALRTKVTRHWKVFLWGLNVGVTGADVQGSRPCQGLANFSLKGQTALAF